MSCYEYFLSPLTDRSFDFSEDLLSKCSFTASFEDSFQTLHVPLRVFKSPNTSKNQLPSINDLKLPNTGCTSAFQPELRLSRSFTCDATLSQMIRDKPKKSLSLPSSTSSESQIHHSNEVDESLKRKRVNSWQKEILSQVFEQSFFPSTEVRKRLAIQIGMSPRAIQIWFQNKRQNWRAKNKTNEPNNPIVNSLIPLNRFPKPFHMVMAEDPNLAKQIFGSLSDLSTSPISSTMPGSLGFFYSQSE